VQKLIGCTKFLIDMPFGTRQWRRQMSLFHNVSDSIGPSSTAHPLDVLLEPDHYVAAFALAFGDASLAKLQWPFREPSSALR
jgi:hypothetical protein